MMSDDLRWTALELRRDTAPHHTPVALAFARTKCVLFMRNGIAGGTSRGKCWCCGQRQRILNLYTIEIVCGQGNKENDD
jgi:hypothetical protein